MGDLYFKSTMWMYGIIFLIIGIWGYVEFGLAKDNYLLIAFLPGLGITIGMFISSLLNRYDAYSEVSEW